MKEHSLNLRSPDEISGQALKTFFHLTNEANGDVALIN
jgi:hypothetical protein